MAEDLVRGLLGWIGEDPDRDGLRDTPARVARALRELTAGYSEDPAQILSTTFDVDYDEMVVLCGVRFQSLCEHHLLPFIGVVDVGYVPSGQVVGVSKLARLVACYARRLQVQERMTQQIADAIKGHLGALGVGVIVRARHTCMAFRGARQPDAEMVTSVMLGCMREDQSARTEFLRLVGR